MSGTRDPSLGLLNSNDGFATLAARSGIRWRKTKGATPAARAQCFPQVRCLTRVWTRLCSATGLTVRPRRRFHHLLDDDMLIPLVKSEGTIHMNI